MFNKHFIISRWIVVGALLMCIVYFLGTHWGTIATTIVFIIVVIGGIVGLKRWCKLRTPFSLHRCGTNDYPFPNKADFENRSTITRFNDPSISWSRQLQISGKGEFNIYIQLRPKISINIDYVNIRFLPENSEDRPKIINFQEISPRNFHDVLDDQSLGRTGYYEHSQNVHKGADLYFIARCEVSTTWKGELSIRFYISEQDARSIRIPSSVNV